MQKNIKETIDVVVSVSKSASNALEIISLVFSIIRWLLILACILILAWFGKVIFDTTNDENVELAQVHVISTKSNRLEVTRGNKS